MNGARSPPSLKLSGRTTPSRPQTGLERLRSGSHAHRARLLFCGLLALVACAVAHVLIVAVARHRRDLAVLRAMGFRGGSRGRQSRSAPRSLSYLCLVGIPIGIVLGRAVQDRIAANFYVVPRPTAPLELLALIGLALVVIAIVASLVPAARRSPPPAAVLRAD